MDAFVETIVKKGDKLFCRYGAALRPVQVSSVTLSYRAADGSLKTRSFSVYKTHHGPVVAKRPDGKWVAEAMMYEPVPALEQSYELTKARSWPEYMKVMALKANTSNNTVYADAAGNIAYLHPQFIPRRDDWFDYSRPVDGADPATDWKGLHALADAPHLLNPATGFIQNTNNAPYSAAGAASPKESAYPRYMGRGDNMRGVHAVELLSAKHDFTLEGLRAAAFDSHLPGFERALPGLFAAYDALPADDPQRVQLADQIALLRGWDRRWAADSAATSLAVFWGEALWQSLGKEAGGRRGGGLRLRAQPRHARQGIGGAGDGARSADCGLRRVASSLGRDQQGAAVARRPGARAVRRPAEHPGRLHHGAVGLAGRHRRPPAIPAWKKRYGDHGNSFVAVVEFGPRVRALAVTAGGESVAILASKHFDDQAERFAAGALREVYFYPEQLRGHTERTYHPGD